jgi:hypothetical protein
MVIFTKSAQKLHGGVEGKRERRDKGEGLENKYKKLG